MNALSRGHLYAPLLALATVAAGVWLGGCGPALKQGDEFTRERVREIMFDDVCQLQTYFDEGAPAYHQETDVNVSAPGHRRAGIATYRLDGSRQIRAFNELVQHLYKRVPKLPEDKTVRVTVHYQVSGDRRTMPITAKSTIAVDKEETTLPYHPCLGAYFFGQYHYEIRRKVGMGSS